MLRTNSSAVERRTCEAPFSRVRNVTGTSATRRRWRRQPRRISASEEHPEEPVVDDRLDPSKRAVAAADAVHLREVAVAVERQADHREDVLRGDLAVAAEIAEPLAACGLKTLEDAEAEPLVHVDPDLPHARVSPREIVDDGARPIVRAVVDEHQLVVDRRSVEGLEQLLRHRAGARLLVVKGDHQGHLWVGHGRDSMHRSRARQASGLTSEAAAREATPAAASRAESLPCTPATSVVRSIPASGSQCDLRPAPRGS
jgi:hypothetical protein